MNSPRSAHASGFTLIEVLIGMLVLALALLGLAAFFPVVVREQRLAVDKVDGLAAQRSGLAIVAEQRDLNLPIEFDIYDQGRVTLPDRLPARVNTTNVTSNALFGAAFVRGWNVWAESWRTDSAPFVFSPEVPPAGFPSGSRWGWDWTWNNLARASQRAYFDRGIFTIGWNEDRVLSGNAAESFDRLPSWVRRGLQSRYPTLAYVPADEAYDLAPGRTGGKLTGGKVYFRPIELRPIDRMLSVRDRRMVWDIVARRVEGTTLQAVMFVRTIDPNIRVPSNSTLDAEVRAGRILPVAADNDGRPTLDGKAGRYSRPVFMDVVEVRQSRANGPWDLLILQPNGGRDDRATEAQRDYAKLPGQKLVDNAGTIHTVVGPGKQRLDNGTITDVANSVLIEAPVSESYARRVNGMAAADREIEVVFTTQIPAAVSVFNPVK